MPQKLCFLFLSIFLLFSTTVLHAQEPAILVPMGALGEFSEMEKQILFNTVQENLSIHYALVSQKNFEKAQEQAYEELDAEECTEDQCFSKIQEFLQVDNLFVFNVIREGSLVQLKLTRVSALGQRTVRNTLCKSCDVEQLNSKIAGLVQSISGKTPVALAAPPVATVMRGKGSVFISSQPEEAEIVLDGKILEDKSNLLLKNLRAGKHQILLRKGNMELQKEFEVKANEMLTLNLKLKLRAIPLLVSSQPFQATVLLDGKTIGQTPLQTKATVGKHKLTVQLKGYVPHSQNIELTGRTPQEVEVFLKALGTLVLTRLHPESQITLDGKSLVNPGVPTQSFVLAPGKHKIRIQRLEFPVREHIVTLQSSKRTNFDAHIPSGSLVLKNLEAGDTIKIDNRPSFTSTASESTLELPPGSHEVQIQRYGFKPQTHMLRLEDGASEVFQAQWSHTQRYLEYQAWSNKRWMIAGSAALAFFYMNLENTKTQTANDEQSTLEAQVIAASSDAEANSYRSDANTKYEEAQQSQQNAQMGLLLTMGLAGWATWVWMDEPPKPQAVGWNWNVTPQQHMSVSYSQQW